MDPCRFQAYRSIGSRDWPIRADTKGQAVSYWDGDLWVCNDCYFAHHYGASLVEGSWFAGESDTPCDREPLGECVGLELADHTDPDTGEGIDGFSWSSCDGCGSLLGGARSRLAYKVVGPAE